MTLSSLLPPDRIQRKSFKWRGFPVTVWRGHRATRNTFKEIINRDLYLEHGTHKDMLKDKFAPRMLCAIRNPKTREIMAYTLLIDGGITIQAGGTDTNGVLGMVGTYTDPDFINQGWATKALQLMALQIKELGGGDRDGINHVFIQYHVTDAFSKIMTAENEKLVVHRFSYLYDYDSKMRNCREFGSPVGWMGYAQAA